MLAITISHVTHMLEQDQKKYLKKKKKKTQLRMTPYHHCSQEAQTPCCSLKDRPFLSIPLNKFWVGVPIPIGEKGVNEKKGNKE